MQSFILGERRSNPVVIGIQTLALRYIQLNFKKFKTTFNHHFRIWKKIDTACDYRQCWIV